MEQIILAAPGKIELRDVPVPEPGEGEVLVRVSSALTCGTDMKAYIRGHSLIPMPGPFGHEYSGVIAKAGKGVGVFKEGDSIMGVHSAPCQTCQYCKKGLENLCEKIMGQKVLGAFAEYILLPAPIVSQNLFHKPQNISFDEAALLEPFSCVIHPYSRLRLNEIDTAVVIGAGPIGLMHLAYMKTKGIKVIVSDYFDDRLAIAEKMGADRTVIPHNIAETIAEETDNTGADLIVECTGQIKAWENSLNFVRRGGTIVFFGGCPAGTLASHDTYRIHYDELTLLGSFHYTPQDVKDAYHILAYKLVDLSLLVTGKFLLKEIEKAFSLLKEGKGIKYALKP